jgi:hypothetical protein
MSASTSEEPLAAGSLLPTTERRQKLRKKRALRDGISRYGVGVSGIGVIIALALIFVYLFYETFPLLKPVSVDLDTEFTVVGDADSAPSLHLVLDRFEQIAGRFSETGAITFFDAGTGVVRERLQIPAPEGDVGDRFRPRREAAAASSFMVFPTAVCCRSSSISPRSSLPASDRSGRNSRSRWARNPSASVPATPRPTPPLRSSRDVAVISLPVAPRRAIWPWRCFPPGPT